MQEPVENQTTARDIAIFFFMWMAAGIIFSELQNYLTTALLGKDAIEQMLKNPAFVTQHLWFFRLTQSASSILLYVLPPVAFVLSRGEKPIEFFSLNKTPTFRLLLISTVVIVFSLPFIYYTFQLNMRIPLPEELEKVEEQINVFSNALLQMKSPADLVFNLIMFAFLPAIGEEFFFRGGVQKLFGRVMGNAHVAIIFSALIFSAVHDQFSGFIPRTISALIFGYMYFWSRNLWFPIFAHMIYNGYQIVAVYFLGEAKMESFETTAAIPFAAIVFSTIMLFLSMSWFYRRTMGRWLDTLEVIDKE